MSAFDAFFSKGFFRAAKCKTLLKLTIPRIKLLRNRREMQLKQMRKEIAKLLETGQEATARIRVEHIIREENMMAAQEILELFCELITVRLPIIESQRECPLDLKESVSSICFAAPRCADLPELQQVQMLFAAKYGREFVAAATELMPDCGVNRQIIELLSICAPAVEKKIKLLKEIAEEHDVDWNPATSESEFLKLHEDLLNGPSAFTSESSLLCQEKYSESLLSQANPVQDGPDDENDIGFESLDLPEVPKASVPSTPSVINDCNFSATTSAIEVIPSFPTVPPSDSASTFTLDGVSPPSFTVDVKEQPKRSLPFVSSLPSSVIPPLIGPHEAAPSFSIPSASPSPSSIVSLPQVEAEIAYNKNFMHTIPAAQVAAGTAECSIPWFSIPSQSQTSSPVPSLSHMETEAERNDDDLKDVLAAAQEAAETAERAASAARAAASLALIRITELTTKKNGKLLNKGGFGELKNNSSHGFEEMIDGHPLPEKHMLPASMHIVPNLEAESPFSPSYQFNHQPSRSPSLEDDPYFHYPSLFSRHNSELETTAENSP